MPNAKRASYFDGKLLKPSEFQTEQQYERPKRKLRNAKLLKKRSVLPKSAKLLAPKKTSPGPR